MHRDFLSNQGRGKKEKFYILTESGIEELIKLKITLEDFWRLLFFVFDTNTQHDLKNITIEKIVSKYEKDVLLFSREYVTPFFDWAFKLLPLKNNDDYKLIVKVLWLLIERVEIDDKEIVTSINEIIKEMAYSPAKDPSDILKIMKEHLLVYQVGFDLDKLSLSHFGFLILLDDLYENKLMNNEFPAKNRSALRLCIKDNKFLPKVLRNWRVLSKILTEQELLEIFHIVLNWQDTEVEKLPLQNDGLLEIFAILRSMNINFKKLIMTEYEAASKIQHAWLSTKQDPENHSYLFSFEAAIDSKLEFPKTIGGLGCKIATLDLESLTYDRTKTDIILTHFYRNIAVKHTVDNFLTFLFYIVFFNRVKQKLFSSGTNSKFQLDIKSNMNQLFNDEKGLEEWYSKWIQEIVSFEKRNLELIEKMQEMFF